MGIFTLAQAGNPDALSALVRSHMPLVGALTRRFSYCEDAFQQGCIGLVLAIRRFREDAGCQFSTYAVPVVLGEMRRAFSHDLGWRARATLKKARAFQELFLRENGREAPVSQVAQAAGVEPAELMLLLERDQQTVYDETGEMMESLPDPNGEGWLTRLFLRDILSRMPAGEQWLLRQRYLAGRSQTELARALRLPQCRISRQEKRARMHFRKAWLE